MVKYIEMAESLGSTLCFTFIDNVSEPRSPTKALPAKPEPSHRVLQGTEGTISPASGPRSRVKGEEASTGLLELSLWAVAD